MIASRMFYDNYYASFPTRDCAFTNYDKCRAQERKRTGT